MVKIIIDVIMNSDIDTQKEIVKKKLLKLEKGSKELIIKFNKLGCSC